MSAATDDRDCMAAVRGVPAHGSRWNDMDDHSIAQAMARLLPTTPLTVVALPTETSWSRTYVVTNTAGMHVFVKGTPRAFPEAQTTARLALLCPELVPPVLEHDLFPDAAWRWFVLADAGGYVSTEQLGGAKHFGVWPLVAAADACFGTQTWPADLPVPQATIEFELTSVEAVHAAVDELHGQGYTLIHGAKTEEWGQTVARFLSPDGLLLGLSYTPWMH